MSVAAAPDIELAENAVYPPVAKANWMTYTGLFLITLATLMFELLLTRIFSLLTYYHFAFMAVSIGLLGGTAGALAVYLFPRMFPPLKTHSRMAAACIGFMLSAMLSLMCLSHLPFTMEDQWQYGDATNNPNNYINMFLVFATAALPFFFGGICVTLALTRFPQQVGRLYAADLVGAALGCLAIIPALNMTDGPTAVLWSAVIAGVAASLFAWAKAGISRKIFYPLLTLLIAWIAMNNHKATAQDQPFFRMKYVKGYIQPPVLYEKWNPFSCVQILGDENLDQTPIGWGMSSRYPGQKVKQLDLVMDANAATRITRFDGKTTEPLAFLKYDIINFANELRSPGKDVLAIGSGGGRDILSGLVYDQDQVTGIEINDATVAAIKGPFADFAGRLHELPNVKMVNDEARSYIERSPDKFDVIQISLIDTWAASSAGAYVLTENSLYTVEAWQTFLEHLNPGGVVTCSRWYNKQNPTEVHRTVALASKALRQIGVEDPRKNIIGIRTTDDQPNLPGINVGTVVASSKAFTREDLAKTKEYCERLGFQIFLSPEEWESEMMMLLAKGKAWELEKSMPINLQPSTDNNPFFFNYVKFKDILNPAVWQNEFFKFNMKATMILGYLLIALLAAVLVCIMLPLMVAGGRRDPGRKFWPLAIYFAGIGLGFMLIEISQMQRLIIFLGHPIYGLTVVLFSVLLASGIGSYLTHFVTSNRGRALVLLALPIVLILFGTLTPMLTDANRAAPNVVRVAIAAAMLFPMGLFLGIGFPIGMTIAHDRAPNMTAWLWGINGATSVLASGLAVAISLFNGISAAFYTGLAAYIMAVLVGLVLLRKTRPVATA